MRIPRFALLASVLIACLVLLASGMGLFLQGIYVRETVSYKMQAIGQDIENVVAAVTLLITARLIRKGVVKAFFVWLGILLALIYSYCIYAFAVHFNGLFLVYVAILGLSVYTLIGSLMSLDLEQLQPYLKSRPRTRLISGFFVIVALLFYLQWLGEDIPALLARTVPTSITESGLLTNPVHVLDIGLLLPAMIITATLLWRRKILGYVFAVPLLVFNVLTGIGIVAMFVVMSIHGTTTSIVVELIFATIVVASLLLSILFLREPSKKEYQHAQPSIS